MPDRSSSRWLALVGPVAAVLLILSFFVLEPDTPSIDDSREELLEHYASREGRAVAASFMAAAAAALVAIFASHLRALTRDRSAGTANNLLLAGSAIYATALLIGAAVHLALIDAVDNGAGEAATTINYLDGTLWMPVVGGLGLMLIGAGWAVLGSRVLPSWLGWVALVVGIVSLLGPGGFLGFFVLPLWLLVAGVMLFLREHDEGAATVA